MKNKRLYGKYIITRVDGTQTNSNDKYFVLKLKRKRDSGYIKACIKAILVYAEGNIIFFHNYQ